MSTLSSFACKTAERDIKREAWREEWDEENEWDKACERVSVR